MGPSVCSKLTMYNLAVHSTLLFKYANFNLASHFGQDDITALNCAYQSLNSNFVALSLSKTLQSKLTFDTALLDTASNTSSKEGDAEASASSSALTDLLARAVSSLATGKS